MARAAVRTVKGIAGVCVSMLMTAKQVDEDRIVDEEPKHQQMSSLPPEFLPVLDTYHLNRQQPLVPKMFCQMSQSNDPILRTLKVSIM